MKREEIAAVQKLELDQLAEQEVAEMRRESKQARERIDAAADALAARIGLKPAAGPAVEPVLPATPNETSQQSESAPVLDADAKTHRETPNFADIAANIAGDDWKDL